ncbi:MAG TPA: peptidase S8 [Kutzneria sp.]|nr:peptidase S8 [Kutzneria sp.]
MFARNSLFTLGAAVVAAVTVLAPVAKAAGGDPHAVTPQIQSLRAQVHAGTLMKSHGLKKACDACQAQIVTTGSGSKTPLSTQAPAGYGADELAAAYHLSGGNTGTIAIIDAGAYPPANLEADVNAYRSQYGLPACTVANGCLKVAGFDGGAPQAPSTDPDLQLGDEEVAVETALDMDMASAACPGCKLVELQLPILDAFFGDQAHLDAAMADFGTAVNTAAKLGASSVSMSYQYPSDKTVEFGQAGRDLFHPGMAVLASSGDGGYEGDQHGGWPANLPWVVSVGGTSLFQTADGYTNNVWSGAGSGCETDLPGAIGAPASVNAVCGGHRASSDVSAVADPSTGVAVYDTYAPFTGQPLNWITVGGTSASSPFIAGLYARGGHLSQVMGPNTMYTAPAGAFTDVTFGQNAPVRSCKPAEIALCNAGRGWDGPTGVGVPNGLAGF